MNVHFEHTLSEPTHSHILAKHTI